MMSAKGKMAFLILVLQGLICLWIWRSLPVARITPGTILSWCALAAVTSVLLRTVCQVRRRLILVGVVSVAIAANTLNIAYELSRDPTSHNLFPLELAMTAVINLFSAGIGIAVASAFWRAPG